MERLVKKRYLEAVKGEPTAVRGGQAKRYYRLTEEGGKALVAEKKAHEAFWSGFDRLAWTEEVT